MTLDYFVELSHTHSPKTTEEFTALYHSLMTEEKKQEAEQQRNAWSKNVQKVRLSEPQGTVWKMISQPDINLAMLPPCSFFLTFIFNLAKPYISKDDNSFYIIDNPIVRDKVFRYPMVRPTSWKGNLYSALWQLGYNKEDDERMKRLFGDIRNDESGQAGRLFFYPTFFTQTSLEIINPHDRKRRVGKNPILFESVPSGAPGTFYLLYVPSDRIGKDESDTKQQALADLKLVAEGLQAMFLTYGFSAKRTSGFGLAGEIVSDGQLTIRIIEKPFAASQPTQATAKSAQSLPKYLIAPGQLRPEYLNSNGTFRERSETELKAMKKADRQEYEKAKKWWVREGNAPRDHPPAEPQPEAAPPAPNWFQHAFGTFDQLREIAKMSEEILLAGGER